jgi:uncharacterized membrane protein YqiK
MRRSDLRKARKEYEPPIKALDLDEELRKLNNIKQLREQQLQNKRDEIFKKKQDQLNTIFFQKELRTMKASRFLSNDKYSFYHQAA